MLILVWLNLDFPSKLQNSDSVILANLAKPTGRGEALKIRSLALSVNLTSFKTVFGSQHALEPGNPASFSTIVFQNGYIVERISEIH